MERIKHESLQREDMHLKTSENLQTDLRLLTNTLDEKDALARKYASDISETKLQLDQRNEQLSRLNKELVNSHLDNDALLKENNNADQDLRALFNSRKQAENEANNLLLLNDKITKSRIASDDNVRSTEIELVQHNRKLEDLKALLNDTKNAVFQKETDLDHANQQRNESRTEADRLLLKNHQLQGERDIFLKKREDLGYQISESKKKLDSAYIMMDSREKDLKETQNGIAYSERKAFEAKEEQLKLQKENETLQILLDKYRNDANLEKQLREEERFRKLQLSQEKRKLEQQAIQKELEAKAVKRELEKVQDTHERLLDNKDQLSQEINAIKQHANLLQSQNTTVFALDCLIFLVA